MTTRSMFSHLIGLLVALAACGTSSPGKEGQSGAAAGSPKAPTADPQAAAEGAKLGAAIDCLNRHSGRVFEVRNGYLDSVDPATGAALPNRPPVLGGLYGLDPCKRELTAAVALTPAVADLDRAATTYLTALEGVHTAFQALSAYYQKGENLDDQGKKAETLHPAAMAAFTSFGAAHADLSSQVQRLNRARRLAALAAREKAEGRKLEVIVDTMMLEGETLVALATERGVDPAALDASTTTYGTLVDEFDAYATAHPDEAKGRGSITNLRNYARSFLAAAKVVARKRREQAEPTDDERAAAGDQYNHLVDSYNSH